MRYRVNADMRFFSDEGGYQVLCRDSIVEPLMRHQMSAEEAGHVENAKRTKSNREHPGKMIVFRWLGKIRYGWIPDDLTPVRQDRVLR